MNYDADRHWPFRIVWEGFAQWLPASTLVCIILSAVCIFMADSTRVWASAGVTPGSSWLIALGAAALLTFFNSYLIHCSVRFGAWRVWPLGAAVLAGIAAGVWFLWFNWHKARPPGPFSPSPTVVAAAALPLIGWGVVLKFRYWTLVPLRERRLRAGECVHCGYSLAGLSPGLACPECGGAR